MNNTRNEAPAGAAAGRALKLSTLGLYAVSLLVACSSDPSAPTSHFNSSAGAPSAGAANVAGAPSAGAPSGGAGGDMTVGAGGGSAGAPVAAPPSTFYFDDVQWVAGSAVGAGGAGGTSGGGAGGTSGGGTSGGGAGGADSGGAGGTAGAAAGAAGAGGAPATMCSTMTQKMLPYTVSDGFVASGYTGGDANQSGGGQISTTACPDRAPGMIGKCSGWTYTPASPSTWAGVAYLTGAGFGQPGMPVCLADGATMVSFYAKGKVGGESVTFTAQSGTEATFVLTTTWTQYSVTVAPGYSTDAAGLVEGFFWKMGP